MSQVFRNLRCLSMCFRLLVQRAFIARNLKRNTRGSLGGCLFLLYRGQLCITQATSWTLAHACEVCACKGDYLVGYSLRTLQSSGRDVQMLNVTSDPFRLDIPSTLVLHVSLASCAEKRSSSYLWIRRYKPSRRNEEEHRLYSAPPTNLNHDKNRIRALSPWGVSAIMSDGDGEDGLHHHH